MADFNSPYYSPYGMSTNTGPRYYNLNPTTQRASTNYGYNTNSGPVFLNLGTQQTSTPPSSAPSAPAQPSQEDIMRNDISSAWDTYLNSLNDQLSGFDTQKSAQEQIANSQYGQGVNDLGLQRTQGLTELGNQETRANTQQAKTLRDISGNLRNSFMAGNVMLGSRGAGDSSAADQYSYALTKLGSQQRGDVMAQGADILSQIEQRRTNLNNLYNNEVNRLSAARDQQIAGISQWYANAQNQIRQMQATGQLQKSQDIAQLSRDALNRATSALTQVTSQSDAQKNALTQWALSNSANLDQLRTNLKGVGQGLPPVPGAQPLTQNLSQDLFGNVSQPAYVPSGYSGNTTDESKRLNSSLFGSYGVFPNYDLTR